MLAGESRLGFVVPDRRIEPDRTRPERLSVSLPGYLVTFVRTRAEQTKTKQSTVVADALVRLQMEERRRRNMAALALDAEQDRRIADEAFGSAPPLPE